MKRFFRLGSVIVILLSLVAPFSATGAFAQNISDFLNLGNKPVEYDQPRQIGRGYKRPDSIDNCLMRKEFFFNEIHNIWVLGLERCKKNSKGVLSRASFDGVSTDPEDEQACVGKRDGQILVHGVPSEEEARRWSERCAYLGSIGGAGPVGTSSPSSNFSLFFDDGTYGSTTSGTSYRSTTSQPLTSSTGTPSSTSEPLPATTITPSVDEAQNALMKQAPDAWAKADKAEKARMVKDYQKKNTTTTGGVDYSPVYTGTGIKVPEASLVASGISKETSLIKLIVFYTNATLPYVSVLSVFAFVAAGLYYILSFTNEEFHTKAKTMMIYVVIGIVIIFSAYTIVNTLLMFSTIQ